MANSQMILHLLSADRGEGALVVSEKIVLRRMFADCERSEVFHQAVELFWQELVVIVVIIESCHVLGLRAARPDIA